MKPYFSVLTATLTGVIVMSTSASAANVSTQDFVHNASIAGEFEIESSQLALDKSQNTEVKKFARQMVDDHTKASEKMKEAIASSQEKPTPATALDSKHEKLLDTLKSASNDNFDKEYIRIQTDAHKEAVNLFESYSKNGKDSSLKDFATQTLPTLKGHMQHVQHLSAKQ